MGSLGYLSPEVCSGEELDNRADIWAFGVMLYEMLTGKLPFVGETLPAAITAILTQPVPDLTPLCPDVPDALADLVYRMLAKDRHQRVPSVRLVGAELEALLKGREIVTPLRLSPADSRFATPTPPVDAPRHNLPVQATPFIGREAELTELARLLDDPSVRLLTILGAGGMGKTRLALEAGAAQIGTFSTASTSSPWPRSGRSTSSCPPWPRRSASPSTPPLKAALSPGSNCSTTCAGKGCSSLWTTLSICLTVWDWRPTSSRRLLTSKSCPPPASG